MASGTQRETEVLDQVIVRFAGDSGDGMQLTGDRFTTSSALLGNDLSTFPDFPAEIRAPAGTVNGVSAFQVHISDHDILTPGDSPNVLVAMNPAALKANIELMAKGTVLIVNSDSFEERDLAKAGYAENPLTDGSLAAYTVYEVPMTSITQEVCKEAGVKPRDAERSKNFFALGLISWMYTRPVEPTIEWIAERFGGRPLVADANTRAFRAGYDFGETAELFESNYEVRPAIFEKGEYVQVTGNQALAWGLIAGSRMAGVPLFLGSYPITPASDILHELSRRKEFGVRTFQAEDEIAGIGAALGASFGGSLGVTTTSGPGLDLKSETIGLAINLELPLVIVDVQRGGPSTGLPTKTEQADLLHAMYGRHGEAPLPILAPQTPSDCFAVAIEAVRLAVEWMGTRSTFGAPLATRQGLQWSIADAAVEISAGRWLTWQAAWKADTGQDARLEAAMAKLYCTEVGFRVVDSAMQILGAMGMAREMPLESWFRDLRVARVVEGTSEMLRSHIARQVIGPAAKAKN